MLAGLSPILEQLKQRHSKILEENHPIKYPPIRITVQKRTKTALKFSAVTMTIFSFWSQAQAASTLNLGSVSPYAVLAGAGITIGGTPGTIITGDIGTFPTVSTTGLENAVIFGVNQAGNSITQAAKLDLQTAYADATGRASDQTFPDGSNLSGSFIGGVYKSSGSFLINGTLILDGGGDPNMVWIFQAASSLTAAVDSEVILTNGALASNVFWQVGSSATLNTSSRFSGSILAQQSISLGDSVELDGRALAIDGAVTMLNSTITVPEPSVHGLLGVGSIGLLAFRRRRTPA